MGKVFGTILGILFIFHPLDYCRAFDLLGITSSVVGLGEFVDEMKKTIFNDPREVNEVLESLRQFNKDVQANMTQVMKLLEDMQAVLKYELRVHELENHFTKIEGAFRKVVVIRKEVDSGIIQLNNTEYESLQGQQGSLDDAMYAITDKLTNTNTTNIFKIDFTENVQKYENVCKTGMSSLQLLDNLVGSYKAITAQYYLTAILILEFLELKGQDNTDIKKRYRNNVNYQYSKAVKKLKEIMKDASLELWRCDPNGGYNDAIRYTSETDPNFDELRIATQYVVGEENFASKSGPCSTGPRCADMTKLDHCLHERKLCPKVRLCPGKLMGCREYTVVQPWTPLDICTNKDQNAHHRYQSLATRREPLENFHCDENREKKSVVASVFSSAYRYGTPCHFCRCICEEGSYYVDTAPTESDSKLNKVVTGARLVLEDTDEDHSKTLRIQIQQGVLLPNGLVNESTLEWKPLDPVARYFREKITIDDMFALTPALIRDDEVVTMLAFKVKFGELQNERQKMIHLSVRASVFDFKSGKTCDSLAEPNLRDKCQGLNYRWKYKLGAVPREKFDLSDDRDASTKSRKKNKDLSTNNQYVQLALTSVNKDGGQSVIPFVDTRKVEQNIKAMVGPLSGASFYVRAQAGYGGFLGIKLMTFDIWKYVDEHAGL